LTVKLSQREGEALAAYGRGRNDITAFSREVLGVEPNPAQERWYRYVNPAEDGWRWRYKFVIHVAANQIGKTLGLAILILWACNYKLGVEAPVDWRDDREVRDWISKPYVWFHVAPSQQQAYIPLDDINLLVQGAHPAQDKGESRGLKCRWLAGFVVEVKVEQYYRGLQFWNGAICQFRTTEDKAKALQGRRAAGISFDEAAFEDHLKAVVNETLMMRLVAMGGPLFMVGTPNGINDYYEFVSAITEAGDSPEERVWVNESGVVCWSIVDDNVGFGLTRGEVDRMEANLDETTREQQLRGAFLEPAEAFFVPSAAVLKAFRKDLPELALPLAGHSYVIMWDPSVAADPTACVVLDVTADPWRGVALKHHKKPLSITELISEMYALHALFNSKTDPKGLKARSRAITGFDSTSMGGKIVQQLVASIHPQRPINFGGPSAKLTMLTNLRAALVKGQLILPDKWMPAKREILNYRLKDDKIANDIVSALAGATGIASRWGRGAASRRFDVSSSVSQSRWARA